MDREPTAEHDTGRGVVNCEREYCGHLVERHNRGTKCDVCPCPIAIVSSDALPHYQNVEQKSIAYPTYPKASESEGTLAMLREKYFEEAATAKGTTCPVCDRYGKQYKRKLNTTMVTALLRLYALTSSNGHREWFEWSEFTESRNEYEKLQFWGLIEHKPNVDDPSKKDSGYWKITSRGWKFARGEEKVPTYVIVYDGRVNGHEEPLISVHEVIEQFHYQQLMQTAARSVT